MKFLLLRLRNCLTFRFFRFIARFKFFLFSFLTMALNSRMHPRNIYKKPPDFKELAIKYPEFRKYVKQELSGRLSLNYSDRKAVMELTKILLLNDFNLRVEINEDRLIPRVPLCLNYVLWVEDLLSSLNKESIRGVDIGTGSVCIYSLLGSTKGWNMLATEIDRTSYENAIENVNRNNLSDKITVKFVDNPRKLLVDVIDENVSYDFCMCNPPFFDTNEKMRNRTRKRKIIDTVASYVSTDTITTGGEFGFVKKLIQESQCLGERVKIYTTLIGKKSDLIHLKKEILKVSPRSVIDTEFCQGKTTRWALAWTFSDLKLVKEKRAKQKKAEFKCFEFTTCDGHWNLKDASEKVKEMLKDLQITYTVEYISEKFVFSLRAYENTWSHQRKKNRLKMREEMLGNSDGSNEEALGNEKTTGDSSCIKKVKLNEDPVQSIDASNSSKVPLVECLLSIGQENEDVEFKFSWLSGNKECVHQIFQYFKNKWNQMIENDSTEDSS